MQRLDWAWFESEIVKTQTDNLSDDTQLLAPHSRLRRRRSLEHRGLNEVSSIIRGEDAV